jgi:amino acid transporter
LEFVALVVLRFTEPELPRPFKVPGGMFGAILAGALPIALLAFAVVRSDRERVLGMNSFLFGALMIAAGFAVYAIDAILSRRAR